MQQVSPLGRCFDIHSPLMSSEGNPIPLSIGPVLDLFQALTTSRPPEYDISATSGLFRSNSIQEDLENISPKSPHLGNFNPIWRYLDKTLYVGARNVNVESIDETPYDSQSTPDTSPPDDGQDDKLSGESDDEPDGDNQQLEILAKTGEVSWKDETEHSNHEVKASSGYSVVVDATDYEGLNLLILKSLLELEDSTTAERIRQSLSPRCLATKHLMRCEDEAFGSEADLPSVNSKRGTGGRLNDQTFTRRITNLTGSILLPSASSLMPAWVTPTLAVSTSRSPMPTPIVPLWPGPVMIKPILTREEKLASLIKQLIHKFGYEPGSSLSIDPISVALRYGGNDASYGIHVFVDSSNIIIGFYDAMKISRHFNSRALIKRLPFSFHSLALIMERGRPAAKRILVGSNQGSRLPDYMIEAERCDYEVSVLERVEKMKPIHQRGSSSYCTSGQSSGSETPFLRIRKVTEQGVDEVLHMKILESIVDYKPSTMVLATGDAAEAEYSGGFLVMVERALEKGWRVELVAWAKSMSSAWISRAFTEKWRGRFQLVELDDYREELLGMSVVKE